MGGRRDAPASSPPARLQVQNGGCDLRPGALTDLGCYLAPNDGRLVSNLLGPSLSRSRPLQPHSLRLGRGVPLGLTELPWTATVWSVALLLGKGADRWFRLSSFLFGAGVLSGLLQLAVQVRGLVFLSLGWVRKTVANLGRSKMAGLGRRRCLLACLVVCDCFAVGAGGLKETTCLRNGKGRKFCWVWCVRHDEHSFVHSHSFPFTQSPETPFNHPLTLKAGTFVRRQTAGAVDGAV